MRWRHKKRGSTYTEVGVARLQVSDPGALRDMEEMVVYRGDNGQLWVRPALEFHDGRFEMVVCDSNGDMTFDDIPFDDNADEVQTWRGLALSAIANMRRYAHDVLPHRRMVSVEANEADAVRLEENSREVR